ncbi:MAG: Uma2 family endonuclease [Gemmataceae bacterium]|nr:Uma2 family endonuclease [Gemmataceae bacterium]
MDTLQIPMTDYAYLEGVSWDEYESLLEQAGARPLRFTYDGGRLEIMTLSYEHESPKKVIGRLIELLAIVLHVSFRSGGSTTMKRKVKEKGLEPDDCYWFEHEKQMRGKKNLDLKRDPPPDLAVEIDVTQSVIKRMRIYAALRVPEVWRFKKGRLKAHVLQPDGTYQQIDSSRIFPFVTMAELQRFVDRAANTDESELARAFMAWVEKEVKPRLDGGRRNGRRSK